jgi:hypothetical protein
MMVMMMIFVNEQFLVQYDDGDDDDICK